MTKQRNDNHSTEFGLWTRNQPELDSSLGFIASDIDWFWGDYISNNYLFMEEKRFMAEPEIWQIKIFRKIHHRFIGQEKYYGFHIIQFENTNPDDGAIFISHLDLPDSKREIDRFQLIKFLRFEIYFKNGIYYLKS